MDTIDPWKVRFSQSSIKSRFRDGRSIANLADGLRRAEIDAAAISPIRLVEIDGKLYSLDNRRLEAFRRAGIEAPHRMATDEERMKSMSHFSSKNDGISVRVRKS